MGIHLFVSMRHSPRFYRKTIIITFPVYPYYDGYKQHKLKTKHILDNLHHPAPYFLFHTIHIVFCLQFDNLLFISYKSTSSWKSKCNDFFLNILIYHKALPGIYHGEVVKLQLIVVFVQFCMSKHLKNYVQAVCLGGMRYGMFLDVGP